MRKYIFPAVCFFAVVLSGCCSLAKDDYNIVLLGDIHYDKIEFHQMPTFNPKVPWERGAVDSNGVFLWRLNNKWMSESCGDSRQSYSANIRMWQEDVPQIIKHAAANGAVNPFDILPAVWLASIISQTAGIIAARCFSRLYRGRALSFPAFIKRG